MYGTNLRTVLVPVHSLCRSCSPFTCWTNTRCLTY